MEKGGDRLSLWESLATEIEQMLKNGKSYRQIAHHLNKNPKTTRNRIAELRRKGLINMEPDIPKEANKVTLGMNDDGSYSSARPLWMTLEQAKDPEHLLIAHGFEPDKWELISSQHKIWNGYSKQDGIVTLYSSSIKVKPKENTYTEEKMMAFLERLSRDYKSPVHEPSGYKPNGKLLELNIADLHLGKLAWSGDSGDLYNHDIARERFFYVINDILTRTQMYGFERILFVWCNDFFHVDGPSKTTTNGTPQDASLQFEQMFELGCEMLVKAIDLLSQVAPVTTMYVASNHDRLVSFFATKYLDAWYRNNPNVTIDSRALSRKAVRFGRCLIGFTHGDKEKKRIGDWLQVEYAKDWGETHFREVHAAHIHSEKSINEDNGQIIRYVSSPTGTDRWHHDSAYVGAIQKAQTFVWDRENGLEDIKNTVVALYNGAPSQGAILMG